MHQYKLTIHILVIFSVFNFVLLVLAAPVPVQRVRDACADMVDGGEDVIIMSDKRAEERKDPSSVSGEMRRDLAGTELPWYAPGEMRRPQYASGGAELPWYSSKPEVPPATSVRTKTNKWAATTDIKPAPASSGGTELPWYKPDDVRRPPYAKGGTELPWYKPGDVRRPPYASGGTELPWYSSKPEVPPATSVRTKTNKWAATTDIKPAPASSGGTELPWYPSKTPPATSVRTKPNKWMATTEVEPASSSSGKIPPVSSSKVLPLSEQEGSPPHSPTKQVKPPKPQSKNFSSYLKLASKLKFWPRVSATAGGAVNDAQRDS